MQKAARFKENLSWYAAPASFRRMKNCFWHSCRERESPRQNPCQLVSVILQMCDVSIHGFCSELANFQVHKTRVKMQSIWVAVEIYRFIDGEIDIELDGTKVVTIYRHEISFTPGAANVTKVRAILTRGDIGRAEDGQEVLCGDNWSMNSQGLILSLRFSGRHPADAAGLINEPAQPTLDLAADSGTGASDFLRWMKKIEKSREEAEAAGMKH